jgi:uncharacterized RDD family membrane protein YckC
MPQGGGSGEPEFGQPQFGQPQYGQPQYGQQPPAYGGGPMSGQPISPVNEIETWVTGKRIVQYIVDIIIYGIVGGLLYYVLHRGHGATAAILTAAYVVIFVAWYFLYWAYIPFTRNGQTLGMSLLGIRVVSLDGGPASLMQLFVRSILLILGGAISLLVGIITMMCSRYRQRVGDHMAKTMVVNATVGAGAGQHEFAGAGQAGSR